MPSGNDPILTRPPDASGVAFWRPHARLAPYVSGYHRYAIGGAPGQRIADVFYPAWISLRFTIAAEGPWSVRVARRRFDAVPDAALFGPTSHAGYVDAPRGWMLGAGITPAGWARLFGGDAAAVADRIVPLADHLSGTDAIGAALARGEPPADVFDAVLLARLDACAAEDPAVARIFAAIADPAIATVGTLADRVALPPRALLEITRKRFGFTPKLLLRRARFLRALVAAERVGSGRWADVAQAAGYWDGSHFLRDCHLFLGMPLGEFAAMEKPLNRLSSAAREAALGAPMQSLHVTPGDVAPVPPQPVP